MDDISTIIAKPLFSLTADEFFRAATALRANAQSQPSSVKNVAYGLAELGEHIGCCQATLYALKKQGVLDAAIISHVGKKIVFDVDIAREAANTHKKMISGR